MTRAEQNAKAQEFYDQNYRVIFSSPLRGGSLVNITDTTEGIERTCRFCGLGESETTFRKIAHAVPEFLGNKILVTSDECDSCNETFGKDFEDHFAKWFGPSRTVSQISGKKGVPTYAAKDVRIEVGARGLEIGVVADDLESSLRFDGPFTLEIPVDTPTQKFVPIKAAFALLKIACSLRPPELRNEFQPVTDWLMGRAKAKMSEFPVMFAFTPGTNPYGDGKVLLLQRTNSTHFPFLWCIVATSNYRFQYFVPFCPSDNWMLSGEKAELSFYHFPDVFPENMPHGGTQFSVLDWSSDEARVDSRRISFHVDRATRIQTGES